MPLESINNLSQSLKNKKKYKRSQAYYFNSDPPAESKLINLNFFRTIYIKQLKNNNYNIDPKTNVIENNNSDNECFQSFIKENHLTQSETKELKDDCW